ncbi:MAG: SDR family NAD(P)-dependent oxidoreductase, partial [Candidatus Aminicenantes bacterium]|nr:SDR family NAD(P)-dependent oxidoreductase [Candidatus Aminicenantes bacterium]
EDYNVTVTCLSPGPTDTAFFSAMDEKGSGTSHFDPGSRAASKKVAEIGVNALFKNKLSVMVGGLNKLRAFSARFAPRKMVAAISKKIMKGHAAGN